MSFLLNLLLVCLLNVIAASFQVCPIDNVKYLWWPQESMVCVQRCFKCLTFLCGIWRNTNIFHILVCAFSDCMGMNQNCISGPLLPTICTAYLGRSLKNQQTQVSFRSSWLIPWISAMTYCVKTITSRYFKEFKIIINKNVVSTTNAQHFNLLILQLFTTCISLLLGTYHSGSNHSLLFKNRGCSRSSQNTSILFKCSFLFLVVVLHLKYFSFFVQKFQLERVNLQEVKRSTYDHTRKCADQLLLLGQVCG